MSSPEGLRGHSRYGRVFWVLGGMGWALMAFGAWGILMRARATKPPELAAWVIGAAVVHDLIVAPVVFSVGRTVASMERGGARPAVQVGLVMTGVLVLYSIPVLGEFGRLADNPSLLPRQYGPGLLAALYSVWVLTWVAAGWAWRRQARERQGRPHRGT
jgi:hypothetical protein